MPDQEENTTPDTDKVEEQPQEEQAADTKEQSDVQEPQADTEEAAPQEEETSEEFDIEQYAKERYQAPPQSDSRDLVSEVNNELAQLPADDDGNIDTNAAAEWFANRIAQVKNDTLNEVSQVLDRRLDERLTEEGQQKQLLSQYPELSKDKEFIEDVFDKRDAAAIRGENISLLQAAERIARRTQAAKSEATQQAARQTSISAAAHLETSSVKGSGEGDEKQRLATQAFHGVGPQSKEARHELLKQYVQTELKEGRIELP